MSRVRNTLAGLGAEEEVKLQGCLSMCATESAYCPCCCYEIGYALYNCKSVLLACIACSYIIYSVHINMHVYKYIVSVPNMQIEYCIILI